MHVRVLWEDLNTLSEETSVTKDQIRQAIESSGIRGRAVCLHSSLRSFGHVEGGADSLIDAFLDAGCTLMVPTFSEREFMIAPDPDDMPERNGWDYIEARQLSSRTETIFRPDLNSVDAEMGAVAQALLQRPERARGDHPLDSFSAIGPLASRLISGQNWQDVYAPLRELTSLGGIVILAGVGLNRMTILHLAETLAGRRLFRRWATGENGQAVPVQVGSCSEGFPNLEPMISGLATETTVGNSVWRIYPAAEAVTTAAAYIRVNPRVTHCGDEECIRCPDMIAGGPGR